MLATNANFAYLLRLQPMRSFHLIYVMFCLLLGGLVEEYLLRARVWRWVLCFGVLSLGMFKLDVAAYPASPHIERPGVRYQGEWLSGFLWIRDHTPKDALFALDAEYFSKPGVDLHGFRAVAERSVLADRQKDGGAASIFPELAERWKEESCGAIGLGTPFRRSAAGPSNRIRRQLGTSGKLNSPGRRRLPVQQWPDAGLSNRRSALSVTEWVLGSWSVLRTIAQYRNES